MAADRGSGSMRLPRTTPPGGAAIDLVVIGASLGGVEALAVLLAGLPSALPPIAVVLHRSPDLSDGLGTLLAERSSLPVVEPDDKTAIVAGPVPSTGGTRFRPLFPRLLPSTRTDSHVG